MDAVQCRLTSTVSLCASLAHPIGPAALTASPYPPPKTQTCVAGSISRELEVRRAPYTFTLLLTAPPAAGAAAAAALPAPILDCCKQPAEAAGAAGVV
jgi:hypothetical protein